MCFFLFRCSSVHGESTTRSPKKPSQPAVRHGKIYAENSPFNIDSFSGPSEGMQLHSDWGTPSNCFLTFVALDLCSWCSHSRWIISDQCLKLETSAPQCAVTATATKATFENCHSLMYHTVGMYKTVLIMGYNGDKLPTSTGYHRRISGWNPQQWREGLGCKTPSHQLVGKRQPPAFGKHAQRSAKQVFSGSSTGRWSFLKFSKKHAFFGQE